MHAWCSGTSTSASSFLLSLAPQCMMEMVNFSIKLKEKEAHENAFMQVQHDGVTLTNSHKYLGVGIQYIASDGNVWGDGSAILENAVLCVAFGRSKDNSARGMSDLVQNTLITRCEIALGMKQTSDGGQVGGTVVGSMRSDEAAVCVGDRFDEIEGEGCYLHRFDKVGLAGTGQLTRSRGNQVQNPFPEGIKLMNVAQNVATHFSRGGDKK